MKLRCSRMMEKGENFFSNMKIRKKMLLSYLLACVIPLFAACLAIYRSAADNLQKSSLEFADIFNSQIVSNLERTCKEYNNMTRLVLVDNDILTRLAQLEGVSITERVNQNLEFQKIMQRLLIMKSDIYNVSFVTEDGRVFEANNQGININPEILLGEEWLKKLNGSQQFAVTAAHPCDYYDRLSDTIALTAARSIFDYRGKYIGTLLLDINPYSLIELSDEFYLARNQYNVKISVTDESGGILYDSDVVSGNMAWQEVWKNGDTTLYEKSPDDYIILKTPIEEAPLYVNIVIPSADLLMRVDHVAHLAAAAVFFSILIVIICSILLSGTISRPLRKLRDNISQVACGEYQVISGREGEDEIGDIIRSYNQMVLEIKRLIQVVYAEQLKQKEAKYLALKTQINPHMLYNTLESIRMKALLSGEDEIAEMIKILAKMFRTVLKNDREQMRIEDELSYVESYMKLQSMRHPEKFAFSAAIEERVKKSFCMSMMLQPIVENSIEHGMKPQEILHIRIEGRSDDSGRIFLRIYDDGNGMTQEKMQEINQYSALQDEGRNILEEDGKRQSIGLRNIAERILLYYGEGNYLRVAESGRDGTTIEICILGRWEDRRDGGEDTDC